MSENETEVKAANRNVVVLGWVAFFGGLSQDMIQPILPTFYSQVLGLNKVSIGLIEGSVTTAVSIFKILSGIISDSIGKRKNLVFIGYLLSAIGRLSLSVTTRGWHALGSRLVDAVGKGMKDAPRDALVAKSSSVKRMGFSFGYQRMLDTLGSFLGPLITFTLLRLLMGHLGASGFKTIFMISGIIAFATILLTGLCVKEPSKAASNSGKFKLDFTPLKGKFALFFIVMLVFTLGNSSDAFLILRAQKVGIKTATIPLLIALFNLFYALLSVPAGMLSDKMGRARVIRLGWLIYGLVYLGFALARAPWHIWALYALYGVYYASTEGVAKSMVAHIVDETHRGTAFGLYNASLGLVALPASVLAGYLWDRISPSAPFYFGAACAIVAVSLLTAFHIEG